MARHGNRILGTALVAIGLLMLLSEMGLSGFGWLWPTILLVIGVGLLMQFHRDRDDSGKVFTGSTLVLLAFFFQFIHLDWIGAREHWPFFLLAPGVGLLVMSRVDALRRDAMVPGWILVGVAAVGYFFSLGAFVWVLEKLFGLIGLILRVAVPVGLIGLGGWLVFTQRREEGGRPDIPEKVEPQDEATTAGASATSREEDLETEVDEYAAVADLPPVGLTDPGPEEAEAEFEEEPMEEPAQEPAVEPEDEPEDEPESPDSDEDAPEGPERRDS